MRSRIDFHKCGQTGNGVEILVGNTGLFRLRELFPEICDAINCECGAYGYERH